MSGQPLNGTLDEAIFRESGKNAPCGTCRHRIEHGEFWCAAFPYPEQIPIEIWRGEHDHRTPFPGDGGVRYAAKAAADREREAYLIATAGERLHELREKRRRPRADKVERSA